MEHNHSGASWAPLARPGSRPSARPSSLPRTICYTWATIPTASSHRDGACLQLPASLQAPNPAQLTSSHFGSRVQVGRRLSAFPYGEYWHLGLCGEHEVAQMAGHRGSLGAAPPGFWEPQPGGSKGQGQGHWQSPTISTECEEITKETANGYRRPPSSLGQTEQPCQGTSCARSIRALFPWNIKKESSHGRQKGKNPGFGTALPFILAFTPSPQLLLVPASHSQVGCRSDCPGLGGNSGEASFPTVTRGQENAPPLRPPASSQNRPFLPKTPIYYKGRHVPGLFPRRASLPGSTPVSLPTLANTCLTSGLSPHPSVT